MMLASAMAVEAFRTGEYDGQIGIVHSFSPVYTTDTSVESAIARRFADNFYNNWILDTAAIGEIPRFAGESLKTCDLSMMTPEDLLSSAGTGGLSWAELLCQGHGETL